MFMRNETAFIDSDIVTIPGLENTARTDAKPALNYGMPVGTLVETEQGWDAVETLSVGQMLVTTEGDLKPLTRVEHSFATLPRGLGLIHVSGGIFPGVSDLVLLPEQLILLTSPLAEVRFGTPDVLLPAAALDVAMGVEVASGGIQVQLTSFGFEDEEVIFAGGDMRLHCPKARDASVLTTTPGSDFWTVLDAEDGRSLTRDLYAQPANMAMAAS